MEAKQQDNKLICVCGLINHNLLNDKTIIKGKLYYIHSEDCPNKDKSSYVYDIDRRGYQTFGVSVKGFYREFLGDTSQKDKERLLDDFILQNKDDIKEIGLKIDGGKENQLLVLNPLGIEVLKLGDCSTCKKKPLYLIDKFNDKQYCMDCAETFLKGLFSNGKELWQGSDLLDQDKKQSRLNELLKDLNIKRRTLLEWGKERKY